MEHENGRALAVLIAQVEACWKARDERCLREERRWEELMEWRRQVDREQEETRMALKTWGIYGSIVLFIAVAVVGPLVNQLVQTVFGGR